MFSFQVSDSISLELLQQHQAEEIFQLIDANRAHLREWLLWVDKRKTAEDMVPVIKYWLENLANNQGFDVAIRYNADLVGMIGVQFDWGNRTASIGYFLARDCEGKGIITTSLQSLIRELFDRYSMNRIEIQCAANNVKSQRVPERLGFKREGIKRAGQLVYDHFEDLIIYSLLKSEV
ncbi:GNAT family N-acetyltransferase [Bacillus sp. ISL-35]|uniref:GNAT family N-acetyltransferase n=1 Tax=Bacillus sp. ISL-35 TaxID=2819122 RepID=UPI001BEAD095|nr:GNAT family protein [Bacillus sp. ISL-35]MBT2679318.1 GNAT family N-acetyltransferase [Bacillus sp. ISL-35]MBT2703216.1 GNAT family N-acetyltransferase [Chryseobacterium sp. ISL-80]